MTDPANPTPVPPKKAVDAIGSIVDRAQRLQAPAVARYVESLRAAHPAESPTQIVERLEKRYLLMVTGTGGAVGAAAAVPGIGTIAAIGALAGETALFVEASALLALSIAEVHGIAIEDAERRRTLVLAVALGEEGLTAVGRLVGSRGGVLRRLGGAAIPGGGLANLNRSLVKRFARKFALRRAPLLIGKLLPAGIGAGIGGAGNRAMGKRVIENAREAFGPPPSSWPAPATIDGEVVTEASLPAGEQ